MSELKGSAMWAGGEMCSSHFKVMRGPVHGCGRGSLKEHGEEGISMEEAKELSAGYWGHLYRW